MWRWGPLFRFGPTHPGKMREHKEVFPLPSPDESTLSGKFASGRSWNVHMVYALDGRTFIRREKRVLPSQK